MSRAFPIVSLALLLLVSASLVPGAPVTDMGHGAVPPSALASSLSGGSQGVRPEPLPASSVYGDRTATSGNLSSVTITPDGAILVPGGVQNFSALPNCTGGPCPSGIQYTWSLTNGLASLNTTTGAAVLVTAGPLNGSSELRVNATVGSLTVPSLSVDVQIDWSLGVIRSVDLVLEAGSNVLPAGASATWDAHLSCAGSCPLSIYTSYNWTLTPVLGQLYDGARTFATLTAGAYGGNGTLRVVVSANGITRNATAPFQVLPLRQHLNSVTIEPYELTLETGQRFGGFQASANCTLGACPAALLNFSWTLTNGDAHFLDPWGTIPYAFLAGASAGQVGVFVNVTLNGSAVQSEPVLVTLVSTSLPTLVALNVTPPSTRLLQGGVQDFQATLVCSTACPGGIPILWSYAGSPSSVGRYNSTQGAEVAFTAGSATGQFTLVLSAYLGNRSVGNSISLDLLGTANYPLVQVSISPSTSSTIPGGTVNLTAVPYCIAGYCAGGPIEYNWTVSGAFGSLRSYNTSRVTFVAGTLSGSEQVRVYAWQEGYSAESPAATITVSASLISLTSVAIDPASSNLAIGGAELLSAIPVCTSSPCPAGIHYTWGLIGTDGHLNPQLDPSTEAFDAGGTSGQDMVRVQATLNGSSRVGFANVSISGSSTPGGSSSSPGGSGGSLPLIAGGILAVAVVLGVFLFLVSRRRRGPGQPRQTPDGGVPPPAPPPGAGHPPLPPPPPL